MENKPTVVGDVKPSSSSHTSKHKKDEQSRGSRSSRRRERGDSGDSPKRKEDDRLSHSGRSSGRRERGDAGDEDRLRRSDRREKEEREAKRKARSSKDDASSSAPGAHASTGEHHSSRKSGRHSTADPRHRSRSPKSPYRASRADGSTAASDASAEHSPQRKSDEKSAYRSMNGAASVPGVQAERSSSRTSSKRDEKGTERRSTRATKPGAKASTSSSDKSKSKSLDVVGPSTIGNNEEALVDAMIVEEEEEEEQEVDVKREPEQSPRSRAIDAAETSRRERQMQAEIESLRQEIETMQAERKENDRKAKKRNMIICIAFLIALICTGVGTHFAGQSSSSSDAVKQSTSQDTLTPSLVPSTFPSIGPTDDPSTAPSTVVLKYPEPSLEDCQLIAKGLKIQGEDAMFDRSFAIPMEVTLEPGSDIDTFLTDLEFAIEKYLVPDLIGCPRYLFQLRRLGHHPAVKGNSSMSMTAHRQLEGLIDIRFAIARAIVDVTVTDSGCKESSSPNCSVVIANMALKVRGDETVFLLAGVIGLVFPKGKDIQPDLELRAPFDTIMVADIQSTDATPAPTIASTGTATEKPSGSPSYGPSASPTSAPATGPTTPAPTKAPTKSPSMAPSTSPSMAPTPTPLPTLAPQPGPSPPPTASPSKSPSIFPTKSPSSKPSLLPSVSPSNRVTAAPSSIPTNWPTFSPTITPAPTSMYLGCFQDDANRVFDVLPAPWNVDGCRGFCRGSGFPYAALQSGSICFCGNQYDSLGSSPGLCNTPCANRADQYCGGSFANSVYLSGAPLTSLGPELESDLYCGCTMDNIYTRDLSLGTAFRGLSQLGCIHYCKSQGFNFAGLQYVDQCFCGNSAGAYGNSINCFTQDKNRDGVYDVCNMRGPGACYDGSDSCSCGGANANALFRTSLAVSCPAENPPYQVYLGCFRDNINRDVNVFGMAPSSVANCRNFCKDMGFAYSAIQQSNQCFCGNNYGNYGIATCNNACGVDPTESGCGGTLANSLHWSGAALAIVPELEGNLYCGCMGDLPSQRDLEHLAPYSGSISQKACIHYCRGKGYDFAGLQSGSQCWCGNDPGTHSYSQNCNMPCVAQEASACYDGSSSCSCGGTNANSLFRTSASVSCPAGAYLISDDYATASFNVATYQGADPATNFATTYTASASLAIDGNICGAFWGCRSIASTISANNPALTIDLGFLSASVGEVVVWNRDDVCCRDRMNGFILELLDSNQNVISGSTRTLTSDREQPFAFSGMASVRYVRISKSGAASLDIAEVQVFS